MDHSYFDVHCPHCNARITGHFWREMHGEDAEGNRGKLVDYLEVDSQDCKCDIDDYLYDYGDLRDWNNPQLEMFP